MVECPICNNKKPSIYERELYILKGKKYDLLECNRCSVLFVHPFFRKMDLSYLYQKEYFEEDYTCSKGYTLKEEKKDKQKIKNFIKKIKILESYTKRGKILDVGCSAGLFLSIAKKRRWEVKGIEISEWAAKQADKEIKKHIVINDFTNVKLKKEEFDAVNISHVLEHLPDPERKIKRVHSALKPWGILIVEVPNFVNSPVHKFLRFIFRISKRYCQSPKNKTFEYFKIKNNEPTLMPFHLFEFNKKSLSYLLRRNHFDIIKKSNLIPISKPKFKGIFFSLFSHSLFYILKFMIETFNLSGGNLVIYAKKSIKNKDL